VELLVNGVPVDALARIAPKRDAVRVGRALAGRLKDALERQQFEVVVQVWVVVVMVGSRGCVDVCASCVCAIETYKLPNAPTPQTKAVADGRVVAREVIRAARKDVLACVCNVVL
jgi:translation elongation factor EF-4